MTEEPRDVLAEIAALNDCVKDSILADAIALDMPGSTYDALYEYLTMNMERGMMRPSTMTVLGRKLYRISEAPSD